MDSFGRLASIAAVGSIALALTPAGASASSSVVGSSSAGGRLTVTQHQPLVLRFDAPAGAVRHAALRLKIVRSAKAGLVVASAGGRRLASARGPLRAGTTLRLDVSPAVTHGGRVLLRLTSRGTARIGDARHRPRLFTAFAPPQPVPVGPAVDPPPVGRFPPAAAGPGAPGRGPAPSPARIRPVPCAARGARSAVGAAGCPV